MQHQSSHHPYSGSLRQRAVQLRQLASSIERSLVVVLRDAGEAAVWTTIRADLCDRILDRNLHQLHQAADDLRETSIRFCQRADELDLAHRSRVA